MKRSIKGFWFGVVSALVPLGTIAVPPELMQDVWLMFFDKPLTIRAAVFLASVWTTVWTYIGAETAKPQASA